MLYQQKWFKVLIAFILIFVLIYLISIVDFMFVPIFGYFTAIAVPFIGAGFLFYVTKPVVNILEKYKVPRILGILIVFLLIIGVIFLVINYIAPIVQEQFSRLVNSVPNMVDNASDLVISLWENNQSLIPQQLDQTIENITNNLQSYLQNMQSAIENVTSFLINFIGGLVSFVLSIVLIPFFLFFMLKDSDKLVPFITKFLSSPKAKSFRKLMGNIDNTLASFIQGQSIVSVCVGTMLYIGYNIIGLQYPLLIAIFGFFMNFIPFVGPFLSAIPAILVGLTQDPMTAFYAIIVMFVAQQIESTFISPNVMGRALSIHPLTIITLILAAGSIAGLVGLLFIIPIYAVIKTIVSHFYEEWKKNQPKGEKDIL
ncbi:AI-2E family transporter [Radiobacillus sp. PE A8.2]|uniref:AI-2E family transporter n=1 Tax=Radiobacillus sp. PE A8.2 TaxID=3380349 RepID=UPI00388D738A